jgi:hypothetical protein
MLWKTCASGIESDSVTRNGMLLIGPTRNTRNVRFRVCCNWDGGHQTRSDRAAPRMSFCCTQMSLRPSRRHGDLPVGADFAVRPSHPPLPNLENRVREKSKFAKRFNADSIVQSRDEKYSASVFRDYVFSFRPLASA